MSKITYICAKILNRFAKKNREEKEEVQSTEITEEEYNKHLNKVKQIFD